MLEAVNAGTEHNHNKWWSFGQTVSPVYPPVMLPGQCNLTELH